VEPARARPGDAVLVSVLDTATPPSGTLADRPLRFWPAGPGRWLAVTPLPTETPPGPAAVALLADALPLVPALEVEPANFLSTRLDVPPRFIEPPASARKRMALDQAAIKKAYERPFGPPLVAGPFAVPLDVEPSGGYGDQRVYNGKVTGVHYGLDLPSPAGTPVGAGGDGEVVLARDCYMSGKTVLIWHGAGVFSASFHLSAMEVRGGDLVKRGQVIGRVGSTGRSTGPHLHWGVKVDGLWVDPRSITRLDLAGAALSVPLEAPERPGPPDPAVPPPPSAPPPPAAGGAAAPPR
jgi:murein DD-endopeptidase MepM/ murein hydrolase activator NlpD